MQPPGFNKCRAAVVAMLLLCCAASAKVVKTSKFSSCQEALKTCVSGDVLVIDANCGSALTNPPSGLRVVGSSAQWNITQDVSDLVFFRHSPKIVQKGGIMRRVVSGSLMGGSRFTGIDSCFFVCHAMGRSLTYEVDGYMRACTFGFDGMFMGASTINFSGPRPGDTWTKHGSSFVINATHPVGDGSGSLIANIITHGQIDWTPVHIVNGRGITVAHIGAEYCEWADPFVSIENGVECVSIAQNPGGHQSGQDWNDYLDLNDGTRGYAWMGTRLGAWHIGGMNNALVGGTNYVAIRTSLTGQSWSSCLQRDPYITKWRADHATGINYAPGLGITSFMVPDRSMKRANENASSYVFNSAARCTTGFIDSSGNARTAGLKPKSLRPGITMYPVYAPLMPDIDLGNDGPGENMTGKSGSEIMSAVNSGKVVYVGAGTYTIPGTLTTGSIFGAGKDRTILKFPSGTRCTQQRIGVYNLTIEGGKSGYTQTSGMDHQFNGMNVRFRGQSLCGMNLGCAQNSGINFIEFDACKVGITTCQDGISCGESGSGGGKIIDKFMMYGCVFKNMETGASIRGGTDGYPAFVGCKFENISGTAANCMSKGNYFAGTDFVNCGTAVNATHYTSIHSCSVQGRSGSKGFLGDIEEVISCRIMGCSPAIETRANAVISDVRSDGDLVKTAGTWVGLSEFGNVKCPEGAFYGSTDLTAWCDASRIAIDQTPPSATSNVRVQASGANNVVTWDESSDPETKVMQYIIERKGIEVGRTNFNYSANFHVLGVDGMWGSEGFPGPGVYRNPKRTYVDPASAGTYTTADYKVVAVNFAQIRSDGNMAALRLWPHSVFPQRLTITDAGGKNTKTSDSVRVPLGMLTMEAAGGGKAYTAVRYRPLSGSGLTRGVVSVFRSEQANVTYRPVRTPTRNHSVKTIALYDLRGSRIACIKAGTAGGKLAERIRELRLPRGTYVAPEIGQTFSVVSRTIVY